MIDLTKNTKVLIYILFSILLFTILSVTLYNKFFSNNIQDIEEFEVDEKDELLVQRLEIAITKLEAITTSSSSSSSSSSFFSICFCN